jgi:hypothetical protein
MKTGRTGATVIRFCRYIAPEMRGDEMCSSVQPAIPEKRGRLQGDFLKQVQSESCEKRRKYCADIFFDHSFRKSTKKAFNCFYVVLWQIFSDRENFMPLSVKKTSQKQNETHLDNTRSGRGSEKGRPYAARHCKGDWKTT